MDKIICFDGKCQFCIAVVKFIIQRDPKYKLRFAPIQSQQARILLKERGMNFIGLNTIYFIDNQKIYQRSEAVLRILGSMPYPYKALIVFRMIPRSLRDAFYKWFVASRYKWFGKNDKDFVFQEADKKHFIV